MGLRVTPLNGRAAQTFSLSIASESLSDFAGHLTEAALQGANDNPSTAPAISNSDNVEKTKTKKDMEAFCNLVFRAALGCTRDGPCEGRLTTTNLSASLEKVLGKRVVSFQDIVSFYENFDGDVFGTPAVVGGVKVFYFSDDKGNQVPFIAESGKDLGFLNEVLSSEGEGLTKGKPISDIIDNDSFAEGVIKQIKKEPTLKEFLEYARIRSLLSKNISKN